MTTHAGHPTRISPAVPALAPAHRLSGLGSVFGKTVRDSRRAFLLELGFLGGLVFLVLAGIAAAYPTQAARDEVARMAAGMGSAAQGLTGPAVNIATMGGYVQWKYGFVFLLIAAFWSIRSLTGTLTGEAGRGSLDLLAASGLSRRRIATEKITAHLSLLTIVTIFLGFSAWLAGALFAKLPGDSISFAAAAGFALWIELMALAFGGFAFVLAQFLGRPVASWIAGTVLVAGPILNNYRTLVPAAGWIADLTPGAWTAHHLPLAGQYDWVSLLPVAAMAIVLLPAGIEAFVRRDLGATSGIRAPRIPVAVLGLRGVAWRSLAERLPLTLAWGLGLGFFGLIMAAASGSLADQIAQSPDLAHTFDTVFPGFDLATAGGFLQLLLQLLFIVAGFAATTLVSGWAGDETSGRLEMVLATPLSRRSWALRSGLGVLAAITLMTVIMAVGVGAGAPAAGGSAVLTPMAGTFSLGLFAAAIAGIGFAVGGLLRPALAAPVTALVVIATYLTDLLVPAFHLPSGVHQLALTAHLGQPMVARWDLTGVVLCLVLAGGGLALGAAGFTHRDLRA